MAQIHVAALMTESWKQVKLAIPLILASYLEFGLQFISILFIGHLGGTFLSSATLANSFTGVTGFSFMFGMGGALETLCGQAYGAGKHELLGIYMQRAVVVMLLLCIPIVILWMFVGDILLSFGLSKDVSNEAGMYAKWLSLSIVPYSILQSEVRFLQTQGRVKVLTIATCLACVVHILGCWLLIKEAGLHCEGAAISIALSYSAEVIILGMYIKVNCKTTWKGCSKDGFRDLPTFLRLGIASALMLCLDFWAYEVLVFVSGHLPNSEVELSLMSISINIVSIVYQFTNGLASAVSTRVANELGGGQPNAAKIAVFVGLFLIIVIEIVLNTILIGARSVVALMFTSDHEIRKSFPSFIPILVICNVFDGVQGTLAGAARGGGWQRIGTYINLGSYYLLGLPCAAILAFLFHLEGKGLWIGITAGCFVQGVSFVALTICTKWNKQAEKARERLNI